MAKTETWGTLPEYLSVYKYTNKINNKNVRAYIAATDMNNPEHDFQYWGKPNMRDLSPHQLSFTLLSQSESTYEWIFWRQQLYWINRQR